MYCQYTKYTYISLNTNESISRFAWEANDSRGIHVYLNVLAKCTYTWNGNSYSSKQIQKWEYKFEMYESSKLDYTSTSNGFK